jgi:hypothetical protein
MRRIRHAIERSGMSAVMERRAAGDRGAKRIGPATIALVCRLKREVYPDFSLRHLYEQGKRTTSGPSLVPLAAANVAGSRSNG